MHSERLLERFRDPTWVGDLEEPAVVSTVGNPTCGDVVQIGLEVHDGLITQARFRTLGCAVAIAASDAVCELVGGQTVAAAEVIDLQDISRVLGGVAPERESCAAAALGALRSAIVSLRAAQKR